MASKNLKVFLPFILMAHSLNCESISLDVKPRNTTDYDFPVTPLTYEEILIVKNLYRDKFCLRYETFRTMIVHNEKEVTLFEQDFTYDHSCPKFFDSISGLLYWLPSEKSAKYLGLFDEVNYGRLIVKKKLDDAGPKEIKVKMLYEFSSEVSANVDGMYLLVMSEPTSYTIENVDVKEEWKSRVEIVDLGTFSFFNPTGDFQEINVHMNLTDDLFLMLDDYYLCKGSETIFEENDNVWKGKVKSVYQKTLERTHLAKVTVSSPLPPRASVTGRIFATIIRTKAPFSATMRINGGNSTVNLAKNIFGEFLKFEKVKLRVENLKMSTRQDTIIFASYIACFVGLVSALIIGCAILLICLVAQKKDKECICPRVNLEVNWAKKRTFIAEKSRKVGKVFAQVGNICGSICNCIYKEVV